jgi:hypothetical protein
MDIARLTKGSACNEVIVRAPLLTSSSNKYSEGKTLNSCLKFDINFLLVERLRRLQTFATPEAKSKVTSATAVLPNRIVNTVLLEAFILESSRKESTTPSISSTNNEGLYIFIENTKRGWKNVFRRI